MNLHKIVDFHWIKQLPKAIHMALQFDHQQFSLGLDFHFSLHIQQDYNLDSPDYMMDILLLLVESMKDISLLMEESMKDISLLLVVDSMKDILLLNELELVEAIGMLVSLLLMCKLDIDLANNLFQQKRKKMINDCKTFSCIWIFFLQWLEQNIHFSVTFSKNLTDLR